MISTHRISISTPVSSRRLFTPFQFFFSLKICMAESGRRGSVTCWPGPPGLPLTLLVLTPSAILRFGAVESSAARCSYFLSKCLMGNPKSCKNKHKWNYERCCLHMSSRQDDMVTIWPKDKVRNSILALEFIAGQGHEYASTILLRWSTKKKKTILIYTRKSSHLPITNSPTCGEKTKQKRNLNLLLLDLSLGQLSYFHDRNCSG